MAYGRARLEENLVRAFPEERDGIKTYLDKVEESVNKSAYLNIYKNENADFNTMIDTSEMLQDVLDAVFKSDEIKTVFAVSTFLHGTPPSKISFGKHCCVAGGLYNGAYGISGGGKSIVCAYESALKKAGVDVFLHTEVTSINGSEENGKMHIVTKTNTFVCDTCVASIHPKRFLHIAPENAYRAGYKARLNELEETRGLFTLYGVLNGETRFDAANIFLINKPTVEDTFKMDGGSRSYYINFSETNPQAVSIIALVPPDGKIWDKDAPDYTEKKNAYADAVKKDIKKLLPELAENIEYLSVSTPAEQLRYTGYYGAYGLMHDAGKTKALPITKINGLYLTGQSVVAPGFFGAIIASLVADKLSQISPRPL
jgi:phytoene dehydrogenase-like protein